MAGYTTDAELIEGIRAGESNAFRRAHIAYFAMVRYFVLNNSGREEDAYDVFQDALVVLYEQLRAGKFELRSSLKTWMYAVCRNRWLKQLQRSGRVVSITDFEPVEPVELPNENEERTDAHRQLKDALNRMGGPCRKLLLLYYYFRKSMEEIAAEMNYSGADSAKNQKYKCLQRLRSGYNSLTQV
ncbi:MAG: sigma-70 family RNA polymerase sigma factor [Bacteroidia bacterium]|jgi:RNA polymerase sigma factor (sigma-70 family)|nr:sigma-70 family RNA polymerase sigma factor [Bacteroidia bacterium]